MIRLIREFFGFLREHRRWWYLPVLIGLLLAAALIVVASVAPALSPFIYPL